MTTHRTDLPRLDLSQIDRLRTSWRVAGPPPAAGAPLLKRGIFRIRRVLARILGPQESFNAAVAENLERVILAHEAVVPWAQAVDAAREELRVALGVLQHATRTLRGDIERLGGPQAAQAAPPSAIPPSADHAYVGFEDRFRGTPADIRDRMRQYLPTFAGASDVLDIGCGRGEFLDLLRAHGVRARGIDVNRAMVDACREAGLDAAHADALAYLQALPDGSLGGLIAAQVVEHLEPRYLLSLVDSAFMKLRPGAAIVLETINPACWSAFFDSYVRDPTHVQPVHPDTLQFLLLAAGFERVEVRYQAPYPEDGKLRRVDEGSPAAPAGWADALNFNVERLNAQLFTWRDYAAIGRRP